MPIDDHFQRYFEALDRARGEDRCYLCRRTPADVKRFFGFDEDGTPLDADEHELEAVVLEELDVMSYHGLRPVCAVCQLNYDAIFVLGEHEILRRVLREVESQRERLWPADEGDDA